MIVRAIDSDNDWTYGRGKNDYKKDKDAVAQSIKTRLQSFLGDCFFNLGAGIDWFNLLGSKNKVALDLAISTTILNTPNVTGLVALSSTLNEDRVLTSNYAVDTTFGIINDNFEFDLNG